MAPPSIPESYNLVETSIAELKDALDTGKVTSVELVVGYLFRIGQMDIGGPQLNSITNVNPNALLEARASDDYRAAGNAPRALEGIPYTLKDGYKYLGMTVSAGSPAFANLTPNENAFVAEKLREAGAVLVGKTNMPPLADGGMARGLYGRAESPYNPEYLTAAFSSGSSNGAATATAASFAAFALGGETVSSGRSPASNNGLVAYTPSRGVISCRGVWPLYGTCDVLVPMTRTISDLLAILPTLTQTDSKSTGDFWREQPFIKLEVPDFDWISIKPASLKGKRIAVPKMYIKVKYCKKIGGIWDPVVSEGVKTLWEQAREDLEAMGAEIVITDFPLVTRYEDESASGEPNNIVGAPKEWNAYERGILISKIWDKFLKENGVAKGLLEARPSDIFPDPFPGCTAQFVEVKNLIDHVDLVALANEPGRLFDIPGMAEALQALEAQRKRDLEDWMDELNIDFVVFPANGDVGKADLETDVESAKYAMTPGVKYSNGNRAIRHLGVPTVSTTMGSLETDMPVNLTFVGKAYSDDQLISYAYAFEEFRRRRTRPRLTPEIWVNHDLRALRGARMMLNECVDGKVSGVGYPRVFVNGQPVDILQYGNRWSLKQRHYPKTSLPQGRLLKQKTIVIALGRDGDHPEVMKRRTVAELFLL